MKKLRMSMGGGDINRAKSQEEFTGLKNTQRFTVDLPEDVHSQFKAAVALIKPKTTMTEITIELIKNYLNMK